ncbi:MAG: SDR family oxidoreductase [Mariniphaga sp.]|jgi:NAD(P)-dependent dehydrogenase (short-subunit alcohol dehydrogenase family)|nr:SDR family oxidoreductase [Mariniphaga sp.]
MENKICLITGCNSGIGKVTAIELAKKGFEIIMLVRDSEKSRMAYEEIKSASGGKVTLKYVDLASLDSIKKISEEITSQYERIDVLINNAGIFKRKFGKSADSFEMTLAVNYFATFALSILMIPLLEKSKQARIINLTSELYKRGKVNLDNDFAIEKFNGNKAYPNSKLLVVYFTRELSKRLASKNITVNCVHPGVVGTDVFREYPKWFAKFLNLVISKPAEGAKPTIFLASSEDLINTTGKYFCKSKPKEIDKIANDSDLMEKIWVKTEELTGIKYSE